MYIRNTTTLFRPRKLLLSLLFFFQVFFIQAHIGTLLKLNENSFQKKAREIQQFTVKGQVVDESKKPIVGVSVIASDRIHVTETDINGRYSIVISSKISSLKFVLMGFKSKRVKVSGSAIINVQLKEKHRQLHEVVVVGYGTVDKGDVTGAIKSITTTQTMAQQASNMQNLLQARTVGVQVSSNGFEPGAPNTIRIRGIGSLTGSSEPLYVIDGIIMDSGIENLGNATSSLGDYLAPQNPISGINPYDIESIQVLKDASATAIYGARGANGVIIITTKKGKKGSGQFSFSTQTRLGQAVRNIEVLSTTTYARYQNKVFLNKGGSTQAIPFVFQKGVLFGRNTSGQLEKIKAIDWARDTYVVSSRKQYRFAVSGGGETGNYFVSATLTKSHGVIPRAASKNLDINMNFNQQVNRKFKLGMKIAGSFSDLVASKGTDGFGGANHSMIRQVILAAPLLNSTKFSENTNTSLTNYIDGPRAWTADYDDLSNDSRILGRLNMDYKWNRMFSGRLRVGVDYRRKLRNTWYGNAILRGAQVNGEATRRTLNRLRYNIDAMLNFKKKISRKHKIDGTVGMVIDKTNTMATFTSGTGFSNQSLRSNGLSFAKNTTPLQLMSEYPTILSLIGRFNYAIKNRYLFTATFRCDGSSRFSKGNRWGYFPAFSFAWKLNKERFLRKFTSLTKLKLRIGYGQVGNQSVNSYQFLQPYTKTEAYLSLGNSDNLVAVTPANLANSNLKWESQEQFNAGLDIGLIKNKITLTTDVYYKHSNDLLLNVPLGPSAGFRSFFANRGSLINKGVECSLKTTIIDKSDFRWTVHGNIAINRNKIGKLHIAPTDFGALGKVVAFEGRRVSGGNYFKQSANIFIENQPVALFFGLKTNGIIRSDEELITPGDDGIKGTADDGVLTYGGQPLEVGDVRFVDQNGDGDITSSDRTIIGNPNPDFTYGFGTTISYKKFSFDLLFNGVYGNDIANGNLMETGYANGNSKNIRSVAYEGAFDAVSNRHGTYPKIGVGSTGINYTTDFSDRIIEDGSFLRLKYVSVRYQLPLRKQCWISSAAITISGQNLLLFTNYSGFDPEVNSFSFDPLRRGIDWGAFPNQRSVSIGVNIKF